MKTPPTLFVSATLLLLALVIPARAADAPVRYQAQPTDTTVTIKGTSTAHEWEMKGPIIGGFVEFPAGATFDVKEATIPALNNGVLAATVKATVRVNSVHSTADHLPGVMDGLMQDALKEPQFPRIEFHVSELRLKEPHVAGQPFTFDAKGDLSIAGVTNKVNFPVTIQPVDKTTLKITGQTRLKMTDYKIIPPAPSFGLGLMKCGDEVTILFDWTVARPAVPPGQ